MNICIGIISYLPDNTAIRDFRKEQLLNLIDSCFEIFNLPIIIVAQNWKNDIKLKYDNIMLYEHESKLGIVGARKELRRVFLESNFDYIIMLDDDSKLIGDRNDGLLYINQIKNNPNMWAAYKPMLLKLFAISKYVFSCVDYRDGCVENGDFFEDMLLIKTLEKRFSDKRFYFKSCKLREISDSAHDPNSTWYHNQFNKHDIGDRTRKIIRSL